MTLSALALIVMSHSACTRLGPDFALPEIEINTDWLAEDELFTERDAAVLALEAVPAKWWTTFEDPALERLVELVRERNITLKMALLCIVEARAQLSSTIGNFFPYQELKGDYTWTDPSKVSEYAPQPDTGLSYPNYQTTSLGLSASWEPDFWGKYSRLTEAAVATMQSTMADYNAALASLTAEVATIYIQYRTYEQEYRIIERNIAIQRENLRVATARYKLGATSERDVQQATAQLSDTEGALPSVRHAIRKASNALCTLLAIPPHDMRLILGLGSIPQTRQAVAVGIPADLLRRRPDVRNAEFQAMAACAEVGATKAELYPSFSLSGFVGFSASNVGAFSTSDIFGQGFTAYGGPSFTWPIFNYGRITSLVRAKNAAYERLLLNYRNTVLAALADTETAMDNYVQARKRVASYTVSSDAAASSLHLALLQYRDGATDFTTVLTAAASLAEAQRTLVQVQGSVSQGLVQVYRELGGGWDWDMGRVHEAVGVDASDGAAGNASGPTTPHAAPTARSSTSSVSFFDYK